MRARTPSRGDAPPDCECRLSEANSKAPISDPIESSELLAGRREVQIVHAGEVYRLLVTRNNKLILYK
ncbi:MAG: hemin uptake protein HemP [Thermoguttaceae bacterium]